MPERLRVVIFCHSLVSDWNHGNAHFLRGIVRSLQRSGHSVVTYEPVGSWSLVNQISDRGLRGVEEFRAAYPGMESIEYRLAQLNLDDVLHGADLVLVHEWNDPALIKAVGDHRRKAGRYRLLFHDTHHRSVTAPAEMAKFDLSAYDGVLAFSDVIRRRYLARGWTYAAWTWHEAADMEVFRPRPEIPKARDLVWIGNWGDDERTAELHEFLLRPCRELELRAEVFGVRYPREGLTALGKAGVSYGGGLPNFQAPREFARSHLTVHVPRRPYVKALPGTPTIRVFEALACGIPLVSAPWEDAEHLFRPGTDFLFASDGAEMRRLIWDLRQDPARAAEMASNGRRTVLERHTCDHRVAELIDIFAALPAGTSARAGAL